MKTEEDEAFDDLARRQGAWGGGYRAKRAAAADKLQEPVYNITVFDNAHPKGIPYEDWVQPAQRPWVGLTDAEIHGTPGYNETREMYLFALTLIAKLQEKNT
jgi:hypothetical protein